jgi:dTDP-4-amino-4,6-dideoxygalactose transaminase
VPTTLGLQIPFTGLRKQYNNLREEVLAATDEVLRSGNLMNGNYTAEFEHWLAKKNRTQYAVTCHSGTHALEILAEYYITQTTVHPKILVPTLTYVASANAFLRAGWDVELVDTDAYGLMDLKKIPDHSYEAVLLIGLYGHSILHYYDVRQWTSWITGNTIVLEDAAQHWLSSDCTRIGQGAAISFDPMKNLSNYGNGGAVVTNSFELAEFARGWRDAGKPNYDYAGTNSRMSEVDCATMLVKTKHLDRWQARRASIADYWRSRFKDSNIRCLITENNSHNHAHHKFVIDINNRDAVKQRLADYKIETKIHYERPLHEVEMFAAHCYGPDMLSAASSLSRRALSLPFYSELTDLEVEYISDRVLSCVA